MLRKREGRIEEALLKARLVCRGGPTPQELESRTANPDDIKLRIKYKYRVTRQVSDLGWVDSDLACSLILLGQ